MLWRTGWLSGFSLVSRHVSHTGLLRISSVQPRCTAVGPLEAHSCTSSEQARVGLLRPPISRNWSGPGDGDVDVRGDLEDQPQRERSEESVEKGAERATWVRPSPPVLLGLSFVMYVCAEHADV